MNNVTEIVKLLDPMFDKLAVLTGQAFELAVRQNYVYMVWDIMWAAALLLISVIAFVVSFFGYRSWKKDDYYNDWEWGWWTMLIVGIMFFLLTLIPSGCAVARYINPEWMAIQDIIGMVRGGS